MSPLQIGLLLGFLILTGNEDVQQPEATTTAVADSKLDSPLFPVIELDPLKVPLPSHQLRAKEVLGAAWKNSDSLVTGEYDAVITREEDDHEVRDTPDPKRKRQVLSDYYCTFDHSAKSIRYDLQLFNNRCEIRYAVSPSGTLSWESDKHWLHRSPETTPSHRRSDS